jgi:hypothetical protein
VSEEKLTTNRIEEALLKKKRYECIKNIETAAENFAIVVNQYIPTDEGDNQKLFNEWVKSMFSYGWQIFIDNSAIKNIPTAVSEKLLKQAVDEFIESVEDMKGQIDGLYNSANY